MIHLGELYKLVSAGGLISDDELKEGIKRLKPLEKDLRELGPSFFLQANEVSRILRSLEDFEFARKYW